MDKFYDFFCKSYNGFDMKKGVLEHPLLHQTIH
jgi:hypothetical protein